MGKLPETPSQTAGPYLQIGLAPAAAGIAGAADLGTAIVPPNAPGERIRIEGRVLDGDGAPVTDVLIEVWQADAEGQYAPGFGWGRVMPDPETGIFSFETVKPGAVPGPGNAPQAPHLNLWLVARGI
ncbi:MAG: protocatechuate 3,4-dioxygenase subunit alpha, partial [Paracoccaceae bacterium]|nr:protocatechuate 3,4-dioxygenase subunit alpha [Paracoccaceae bacterium]